MTTLGRTSVAAALVAMLLAGCDVSLLPAGASGSGVPTITATPGDRMHAQALDALARWADAVEASGGATITFTGPLTDLIGEWDEAVADNNTRAYMAGRLEPASPLSDERPGRGKVKWVDGDEQEVGVLSAADALAELVDVEPSDLCKSDCTPLIVTDATLATSLVETSLGPAEAPTWVFTIEGSDVRVTRVAVDASVSVDPPPYNADDPPIGLSIDVAIGTAASSRLEGVFAGAVDGKDKPCGADYTGEAVESDLAVVVIVNVDPYPKGGACELGGPTRRRSVVLTLENVLGDRTVLEIRQGLPVPLVAP